MSAAAVGAFGFHVTAASVTTPPSTVLTVTDVNAPYLEVVIALTFEVRATAFVFHSVFVAVSSVGEG